MNSLRNELDTQDLIPLRDEIRKALRSAEGYENKLKLTVALQTIVEESTAMLGEVDAKAFLTEIRAFTDELLKQSEKVREEFHQHLELNDGVTVAMTVEAPLKAAQLQSDISRNLAEYDKLLKELIETRQQMPLECRK